MASPFEKMLNKALAKSSATENILLREAQKIISKGYPETEIIEILKRYKDGLIDKTEVLIVTEALEEIVGDEDDY